MKTVKKIIVTLVIFTTVNLMHGAAEDQVSLNNQLIVATSNNEGVQVIQELLDRGANPDAYYPRMHRPLSGAAALNNIEVVKLLLDRGADPSLKDSFGQTAKDIANEYGFQSIVEILQEWEDEDIPVTKGVHMEDLWNQ